MRTLTKFAFQTGGSGAAYGAGIGAGIGAAGNAIRAHLHNRKLDANDPNRRSVGRSALKGGAAGAAVGGLLGYQRGSSAGLRSDHEELRRRHEGLTNQHATLQGEYKDLTEYRDGLHTRLEQAKSDLDKANAEAAKVGRVQKLLNKTRAERDALKEKLGV